MRDLNHVRREPERRGFGDWGILAIGLLIIGGLLLWTASDWAPKSADESQMAQISRSTGESSPR
jgi:hypothetical protein